MIFTCMKIFGKTPNTSTPLPAQNAIPGVFALFEKTNEIVRAHRTLLAGYTAWNIIPAIIIFGSSFFTLTEGQSLAFEGGLQGGSIILDIFVRAALAVTCMYAIRNIPFDEVALQQKIRRAFPTLLSVFAFLFFVIIPSYLLLIPGILMTVWFTFAPFIPLDSPERIGLFATLAESKRMVLGRFFPILWRILGGLSLYMLIFALLCLGVLGTIALFSPSSFAFLFPADNALILFPPWANLLVDALVLPIIPYIIMYRVALYEALKTR